ncbi:MAG: hypothetical protein ACI4BA_06780 [Prevotella sp.]
MQLPVDFTTQMNALLGSERAKRLFDDLAEEPVTAVRVNGKYGSMMPVGTATRVPWCDRGWILEQRPNFTFDPLLHAGCYYVQEASSMFLHRVISTYVSRPVMMLDMCAAPGGKTTVAIDALPQGSLVVCNEPIKLRAQILVENVQKWGAPGVMVTNAYPEHFAASSLRFDVVLCDVPCSGEGMFRKDAEAVAGWSRQRVAQCAQLQRDIVQTIWGQLRDGGIMVYSTCTFNTLENEENVKWIAEELGAEVLPVAVDEAWRILPSLLPHYDAPVYRFLPGYANGEGLFMAVLKKHGNASCAPDSAEDGNWKKKADKTRRQNKAAASDHRQIESVRQWLKHADGFVLRTADEEVMALPLQLADCYDQATRQGLKVLSAGVPVARIKGRDLIPHHALAMSGELASSIFPSVEVSYATAVDFLRCEVMALPESTPKGFVLLTYRGVPLGFCKNIGSRANNLYPREWRIKSTHIPEETTIFQL